MKDKDSQLIWEQYNSPGRRGDPKDGIPFPDGKGEMGEKEARDETVMSSVDELMDRSLRSLEKGDLWEGSEYVHNSTTREDEPLANALRKIKDIDERGVYIMMYHIRTPEGDYVDDEMIAFIIDDRYSDEYNMVDTLGAIIFDGDKLEVGQVLDGDTAAKIEKQHRLHIEEELPEPSREPDYDIEPDYRRGLGGDYI
jgi:hypothetical protein